MSDHTKKARTAVIILAGGKGSRMQSQVHKQYMLIKDKPVLYYTLKVFEQSRVDEIILVCGQSEIEYCRKEIIEKYDIKKITAITEGGKERYHSVYNGLEKIQNADYVLIHDGARPFVTEEIIDKNIDSVQQHRACITAVPSKDTIKIIDERGYVIQTPDRRTVWNIQTPQTFETALIKDAYALLLKSGCEGITDDAMVVEKMTHCPVKIVEGNYKNIKITTPEDMNVAQLLVDEFEEKYNILNG